MGGYVFLYVVVAVITLWWIGIYLGGGKPLQMKHWTVALFWPLWLFVFFVRLSIKLICTLIIELFTYAIKKE